MNGDRLDAVVVGAGISGLTTAFRLARGGMRVAVLEAAERVGGAIETAAQGAWRFELGPNTVVESDESVGRLIRDSGLEGERIVAAPAAKRRYLYKGGRLVPLPANLASFFRSPLFPAAAKLRLLREPWVGRPPEGTEESVAQFVRRRLGPAFLDDLVGPFVSGVYAGDPEQLSVRWAIPRLHELEREHGSLIRGMVARRSGAARKKAGPRGAMFSFREGLQDLPRRLAREIGDVRTGVAARQIARDGEGFRIDTSAGAVVARQVVLAVPADVAGRLLEAATSGASLLLGEIPYAAVAVVSLGWRREAAGHPLDGFGFLVPRKEGLRTLGCLFPSTIFPGRAPEGHVALAAFAGGRTDPEIAGWDEDRIAAAVIAELRGPLSLRGAPAFQLVRRWPRAIPQYELGHGRFVARAKEIEQSLPGLRLAGNYLSGVSVPDCVKNGTVLAEEILQRRSDILPS